MNVPAIRSLTFQFTEEEAITARNKLLEYLRFMESKTEKTLEEVKAETTISAFVDKLYQQLPFGIGPTYREAIYKLNELNAAKSQLEFSRAYEWFLYHGIHVIKSEGIGQWILLESEQQVGLIHQ